MSPLLTDNKDVLKRVISGELWPGGPTPLWSGIHAGMSAPATKTPAR